MDQAVSVCAIFDMDGTLADTRKVSFPALCETARDLDLAPPSAARVAGAIGISGDAFYRAVFPDAPVTLLPAVAEKTFCREKEFARGLGRALLFDGVYEALELLRGQGVMLAIASTGESEHVENILSVTALKDFFQVIRCNSNDKDRMVRQIVERYPSYAFAMTGDKPKDSTAARLSRVPSIGAGYGFSTEEELAGFDAIASSPAELPEMIMRISTCRSR